MIEWRDDAILLSTRKHGETSLILSVLTKERGRHAGLVRGGQSRKLKGVLQPGNRMNVTWRARIEDHLGTMNIEPVQGYTALLMLEAGKLLAMTSALSLIEETLPEREPHSDLFESLDALMLALEGPQWAETYARWEVGFLAELGFGLDLGSCAATGVREDLYYVSPKTGKAICRDAGKPYHDKLLKLPGFLASRGNASRGNASPNSLGDALHLSGYFLKRHIFSHLNKPLPDSRIRLQARFR
jgi:DNA repair protein RecO (recombination protein O)